MSNDVASFMKIMQSFILIKNTKKRDWIRGGKIFVAVFFFSKMCSFVLADIEYCPIFLDYANSWIYIKSIKRQIYLTFHFSDGDLLQEI